MTTHRLIRALLRQPVDRTPIWIMRQAGRYLPEYRELRARAGSFLALCKTPEWACEVTLQPLRRFDLDAAILFSDILTIPDAMGLGLSFVEGEGPRFASPLRTAGDIKNLVVPEMEKLCYVFDTVTLCRQALNNKVPLIGFAGSPWTLACYMTEGQSSRDFHVIKKMLYQDPELLHVLLEKLATTVTHYLNAQIEAGAEVVMLFDTWGGILTTDSYQRFSLHYMQKILDGLTRKVGEKIIPVIFFTKGSGLWLESIAATGCDAIGVDWTINIGEARARVGDKVALQGNLDPSVLLATPEKIAEHVAALLKDYGPGNGHVFNLGHGITPDIDPAHVQALVEAVHR